MEVAGGVGTGSVVGDVLSRAAVQAQIPKDQHLVGGEGQEAGGGEVPQSPSPGWWFRSIHGFQG